MEGDICTWGKYDSEEILLRIKNKFVDYGVSTCTCMHVTPLRLVLVSRYLYGRLDLGIFYPGILLYAHKHACAYTLVHLYMHVHTHTHTHTCTRTHTCTHTHTMHTHMYTHTHTQGMYRAAWEIKRTLDDKEVLQDAFNKYKVF